MSNRLDIQPHLTCPSCWMRLRPGELLWISTHPDLRGDPFLGDEALKRFVPSRFDAEGFALDSKGSRCQSVACPRCHLPIPRILVEIKPTFVSVLGAPSSGKSYFLAASVWECRKRFGDLRVTFTDADPVANHIVRGYEQKLFLNTRPSEFVAIPKTEEEGELYQLVDFGDRQELFSKPFVYSLRPKDEHVLAAKQNARLISRALCLYDNAGEHFQPTTQSELSPATDHLALSEALIYVFDPLQHPRFRTRCRDLSNDPQLSDEFRCHRQDEILLEAAKRIRQKANLAEHEQFRRPLIVAVNKYDVWRDLLSKVRLERLSPYKMLKNGVLGLNISVLTALSRELRALLAETAPEVIAACEGFCTDVTYLPVSPQGCSPEAGDNNLLGVRPEQLHPVWAEVPLMYAIHRAKCSLVPGVVSKTRSSGQRDDDSADDEHPPHLFTGTG